MTSVSFRAVVESARGGGHVIDREETRWRRVEDSIRQMIEWAEERRRA
jgi:hypothetical protein